MPAGSSDGLMQSVAPNSLAKSNLEELISIAKILEAPRALAPWIIAKPTAPKPNTATEDPGSTLQVFQAAPRPVLTPQPNKQTLSKGEFSAILAQEISLTTVYSRKL